jgi:hypothetical protein
MMTYKARKRLAIFVLVVGLPVYIIVAVTIMSQAARFPIAIELLIYVVLGIGWAFPLKWVFMGIGQNDPEDPKV